jgi:hypothetical protein
MTSTHTRGVNLIPFLHGGIPTVVDLIIHNQVPGIELVSPVYTGYGIEFDLSPNERVNFGSTTHISFDVDIPWEVTYGILMYRLQRKNFDEGAMSSEEEVPYIYLAITWKVYGPREVGILSILMEHDKNCIWDENNQKKLDAWCNLVDPQDGSSEDTWLMHDNTVLMKRMNISREGIRYKIEFTISEGNINKDTQRPWYFGVDR